MLADHQIREMVGAGCVSISPYDPSLVQPASLDMRLGSDFIRYHPSHRPIDPKEPDDELERFSADEVVIAPGEFLLGTTVEVVETCSAVAARIEGKSTLGRLGLIVHSTAGFVDPGFRGNITLELANVNSRAIILRSGMRICQVSFYLMSAPAERPYGHADLGSHYQGQSGVTPAMAMRSDF